MDMEEADSELAEAGERPLAPVVPAVGSAATDSAVGAPPTDMAALFLAVPAAQAREDIKPTLAAPADFRDPSERSTG